MGVTGAGGGRAQPEAAAAEPWPEPPPPRRHRGGGGAGRLGFGVVTALALALSAALFLHGNGDGGNGSGSGGDGRTPAGERDGPAGDGPPDTSDGARYTLEPPAASGHWTRSYLGDPQQVVFSDLLEDELGLHSRDSVGARYADRDLRGRDWVPGAVLMHLDGFWGEIEDPVAARDGLVTVILAGVADQGLGEPAGERLVYAEGDVAISCWQIRGGLHPLWNYRPVWTECLWADHSTVALVTLEPVPQDLPAGWDGLDPVPVTPPLPVSLKEAAEVTEQLRIDSLRRTGPAPAPTDA
ncbi:hypothetical protein [Streptomyces sp. YIM 98790]|uniref:hypothetical protein n=1 Tax=Streptomyces sp. YIM 98790 TaxID=2689077 RepID=UPI0014073699|nr:hypothetical protein [Streptomyces sp. YIM 98790]